MAEPTLYERLVPQRSRRAMGLAALLFGSIFSYFFFSRVVFEVVEVTGQSMTPTLHAGDTYLMHRWPRWVSLPERGDIVAIADPLDGGLSVKRVVALPGETVEIADGKLLVEGELLIEDYLIEGMATYPFDRYNSRFVCQDEDYFLLGDNRRNSIDGRIYGPVPRKLILGFLRP